MSNSTQLWLAADYHFPALYCCRVPITSPNGGLALPAPGPATVRLALIRAGIRLFGIEHTREKLFPVIRDALVLIRPPAKIAISNQILRAYKVSAGKNGKPENWVESIVNQEKAHAQGLLTIFFKLPADYRADFEKLFHCIGYWGRTDSLASCMETYVRTPNKAECAMPLRAIAKHLPVQPLLSTFANEFRDKQVQWEEVTTAFSSEHGPAIQIEIFVWPLVIQEQTSAGKLLVHKSII
jgi:hypothetical protein